MSVSMPGPRNWLFLIQVPLEASSLGFLSFSVLGPLSTQILKSKIDFYLSYCPSSYRFGLSSSLRLVLIGTERWLSASADLLTKEH